MEGETHVLTRTRLDDNTMMHLKESLYNNKRLILYPDRLLLSLMYAKIP